MFSDIQSYYKPGQHLRQLFGRDIVYPILQIQLGLRDELHLSFRNNRLVRSWCQMRLEMLRFLAIEAVDKYAPHVDWTVSFAEKTIPYEHWEVLCPHWEVLSLREAKVCMEFHLLGPDEMFFVLEAILFRSTIADSPWNQTPLSDRTSLVKAIAEQVQRDPEKMAVAMKRCFARYLERQSEKNPGIGGMGGRAFNYSIDDDFETARLLCDNLKKSLNDEERTELEGKLLEPKVNDDLGWFRVAWLGNPPPENPVMRVDSDN